MSALVRYAGYDPEEGRPGYYSPTSKSRMFRAYQMFKAGFDTLTIAERFGVGEHRALTWINWQRSKHRNLPIPYKSAQRREAE